MFNLPLLEPMALQRSQKLLDYIVADIQAKEGAISFARYMDLALYTPGLGYYSGGALKFGPHGDFITAPELSSLFSQCLARQCQEILQRLGTGDILEVGAGSGQMAADLLIELAKTQLIPTHYYILELSAELQQRQQEKIASLCPELYSRVQWLNALPPQGFQGIILANEVLDAMPVHRFYLTDSNIQEIQVVEHKGRLQLSFSATKIPELLALSELYAWNTPYTSEINLNLKPWISSLADILKSGAILLIDYGFPRTEYYHPDRNMGTLMCHYKHHSHTDALLYPGLQDITAHVDFTAIAEAASTAKLEVLGFTHQAAFLLNCGLLEIIEKFQPTTIREKAAQNHAIQLLSSPAEMGELFKVIALGRNVTEPLIGFSAMDRRYSL